MPKALLDTDIFADLLRDGSSNVRARANAYLSREKRFTICSVTVLELVRGMQQMDRPKELQRFLEALPSVEVLSIGVEEATVAGLIHGDLSRLGRTLGRADATVAAAAIVHGLVLVTGNEAHYQRIQALPRPLVIDNWRQSPD